MPRLRKVSLHREWALESQFVHLSYILVPLLVAQATPLPPVFRGPSSVLGRLPSCQSGVSYLPQFWEFPHHSLDPFLHIILRLSFCLEFDPVVSCGSLYLFPSVSGKGF